MTVRGSSRGILADETTADREEIVQMLTRAWRR